MKTGVFACLFLIFAFLIGCAHVREYPQPRVASADVSVGDLTGMSKVDIVKKLGQPLATSQSEVSESWYYARPCEIWIWFDNNRVERWEVN